MAYSSFPRNARLRPGSLYLLDSSPWSFANVPAWTSIVSANQRSQAVGRMCEAASGRTMKVPQYLPAAVEKLES